MFATSGVLVVCWDFSELRGRSDGVGLLADAASLMERPSFGVVPALSSATVVHSIVQQPLYTVGLCQNPVRMLLELPGSSSFRSRGFRSQRCMHEKAFSSDTAITLTLPDSNASVSVLYDAIQQQFDDESRVGFKFTAGCWVLVARLSSGLLSSAGATMMFMPLPPEFYGESLVSDLQTVFRVNVSALLPVCSW